ncbi:MAG: FG-GAP-like repeat-containing protein, partial [Planctomycetota bacterium]
MPDPAASTRRRRRQKWLLLALAVFLALTIWLVDDWRARRADEQKLAAAAQALKAGQWQEAEELGEQLSRSRRLYREGLLVAGEAAARLDRPVESLAYYAAIPDDGSRLAQASQLAQAELFLDALPRLSAAEALYGRVLELAPQELIAHERLAYLLGLQGRSWEAIPHRLELLRQGRSIPIHMALLGLGDAADENPESVEPFYRADGDDAAALLAMARVALRQERLPEARRWLDQSLARRPQQWRGQAWRGQLLVTAADWDGYQRWLQELPPKAGDYPEIWQVRAQAALALNDMRGAIRCSWEVLRRDPNHQPATYALGRALQATGEESSAQLFFERSKKLQQLLIAVRTYQISQPLSAMESACRLTNELGLHWECWGWYQLLAKSRELTVVERAARDQAFELARRDPQSRTAVEQRLAEQFDFSSYALPADRRLSGVKPEIARAGVLGSAIQFSNETAAAGVDFFYSKGTRPETAGENKYEISGGSASVLDFDLDGRPDLYLAQGTDWPPREENMQHLDGLFRNRGAGRFDEVAVRAGIWENRFSQGVAVGDYDNDGFPDLYVGN